MGRRQGRRDSAGHIDPWYQRRRRYEAVLRPLGLWEAFAAMPRRAQELFCQYKFPDPVLEFADGFPDDRDGRALRKMLEARFRAAVIEIDEARLTVRDFFSVIAGLNFTVRDTREQPGFPEPCVSFMEEAGPLLERWFEWHIPDAWTALHAAVIVPLVARSRLDGRLLTASLKQDFTPNGKFLIRMTAAVTEAQMRRVPLDGAARPMYRVGTANEWDGVRWLSWEAPPAGQQGRGESHQPRPVYVQSHALRQLHSRVNLPTMAPYLESWLHDSLKAPLIVDRHANELLVEYRIQSHRIGYLVVTPLQELVAVRTFKFLTMEGSPEARMLQKRLRLTRRDAEWLGLHDLAAFTQTDLKEDPVLRPVMEECGCGHLFELADGGNYAPESKALAAEVRRYLRMAA